jgi:hypothetical protein
VGFNAQQAVVAGAQQPGRTKLPPTPFLILFILRFALLFSGSRALLLARCQTKLQQYI